MDERFTTDYARGCEGELFLAQAEGLLRAPKHERRWDLFAGDAYDRGGITMTVEVKTDSYDRAATPNFFMELRTRIAGHPGEYVGGPWRAASHGVDRFVYLYHNPARTPSVAYWFDNVPELVAHLDGNRESYQTRRVRYGRVTAVGLLVPRAGVRHLCRRVVYDQAVPETAKQLHARLGFTPVNEERQGQTRDDGADSAE